MENDFRRLIGLTGGIATGKSTVSRYLAEAYHLPILDADIYARKAVQVGSPILAEISQRYGQQVKLPHGELNRQRLGEIIFNNVGERFWLESKIHPYVRERFQEQMQNLAPHIIVLVIPLLFESKMTDLVTETWVVACSEDEQIRRLMKRNKLTKNQAIARLKSQLPLAEKIAIADVVLDNSSSLESLYQQVDLALSY